MITQCNPAVNVRCNSPRNDVPMHRWNLASVRKDRDLRHPTRTANDGDVLDGNKSAGYDAVNNDNDPDSSATNSETNNGH